MATETEVLSIVAQAEQGNIEPLLRLLKELADLAGQSAATASELDDLGESADRAGQDLDDVGDEAEGASRDFKELEDSIERLDRELEQAGSEVSSLKGEMAELRSQLKDAKDGVKTADDSFKGLRETLIGVQRRLGELALEKTIEAFKAGAKAVADFDQSMARVQTNTGATGDSLRRISDLAQELGATTNRSADEAASAFFELSKAGFTAQEIIASGAATVTLAQVAFTDMATAAGAAATQVKAFGGTAEDLERFVDQIAQAGQANTTIIEIAEALARVAPIAKIVNEALGETGQSATDLQGEMAALLQVLADSGVVGARAGEGLGRVIRRLQGLRDGSQRSKDALAELGLTFDQVDPAIVGISQALLTLADAELTSTTGTRLVGEEAATFFNILTSGKDKIIANTEAMRASEGEAQRLAAGYSDNLKDAYDQVISAAKNLAIEFGKSGGTDAAVTSLMILAGVLRDLEPALGGLGKIAGLSFAVINTAFAKGVATSTNYGFAFEKMVGSVKRDLGILVEGVGKAMEFIGISSAEGITKFGSSLREDGAAAAEEFGDKIEATTKRASETIVKIWGEDVPRLFEETTETIKKASEESVAGLDAVAERGAVAAESIAALGDTSSDASGGVLEAAESVESLAESTDALAGSSEAVADAVKQNTIVFNEATQTYESVRQSADDVSESMKLQGAEDGVAALKGATEASIEAAKAAQVAGEAIATTGEEAGGAAEGLGEAAEQASDLATSQEEIGQSSEKAATSIGELATKAAELQAVDVANIVTGIAAIGPAAAGAVGDVDRLTASLNASADAADRLKTSLDDAAAAGTGEE